MKTKIVYNNALNLCKKLISIYFNDYINITHEKRKRWINNMILIIHLLRVKNLLILEKKMKK